MTISAESLHRLFPPFAFKRGIQVKNPVAMALAWLPRKPVIAVPLIGATKPSHIGDAVAALSVRVAKEDVQQLEEL